jgi:heme exporter protein C
MLRFILNRNVFLAATLSMVVLTLWMVFIWVPTETNQGAIYRSLFFHVPLAWVSMVSIVGVAIASLAYLRFKDVRWDRLAVAMAETGIVCGALMLLSGMIWARPVWGVWWTGEAKLTTALIMFFIYVAYLMFRAYYPAGAQRQRLAAIIAVIGAIDSVIIYVAADLWQRAHPPLIIGPAAGKEGEFASEFGLTLLISVIAFTMIYAFVASERYRIRTAEDDITELRKRADALEGAQA